MKEERRNNSLLHSSTKQCVENDDSGHGLDSGPLSKGVIYVLIILRTLLCIAMKRGQIANPALWL